MVADINFSGYPFDKLYKKVVTTDRDGSYEIKLPWADPYHVVINPDGYMIHQQSVPAPKDNQPVELNFVIKALLPDKVFVFNNIQFEFDKATIKEESYEILNDIALTLLNNPEVSLEISGHTCSIGDEDYNQRLSERRAKAVVDYLVGKKISRKRLEYKGYGETDPSTITAPRKRSQPPRRSESDRISNHNPIEIRPLAMGGLFGGRRLPYRAVGSPLERPLPTSASQLFHKTLPLSFLSAAWFLLLSGKRRFSDRPYSCQLAGLLPHNSQ